MDIDINILLSKSEKEKMTKMIDEAGEGEGERIKIELLDYVTQLVKDAFDEGWRLGTGERRVGKD